MDLPTQADDWVDRELRRRRRRLSSGWQGRTRAGAYRRIQGELKKLGVSVSATGICSVLRRHGLPPAPRRDGPSWKEFLSQQAAGIVACDFFCVETVWLKTLYVLDLQYVMHN